jgi:phosphatidylserine decarboxylase
MSTEIVIGAIVLGSILLCLVSLKWCLPKDRASATISLSALLAFGCGLLLSKAGLAWPVTFILTGFCQAGVFAGVVLWLFYRDPDRIVPPNPGLVVSPADGNVIYLRRLQAGELLRSEKNGAVITLEEIGGTALATEPLWQVGISLVYTDVHVNRAPIEGRVTLLKRTPGQFLSLRRKEAVNRNERQTMVIEHVSMRVILVQIASRLVRQIVAYVKEGETVERGQRVGILKFGSQVDLFMPVDKVQQLMVAVGQRVTAGVTVVARHL